MTNTTDTTSTVTSTETYADSVGNWHAVVKVSGAGFTDEQTDRAMTLAREAAELAIVNELVEREQKSSESPVVTRLRILAYLQESPLVLEYIDLNPHTSTVTLRLGERTE